VKKKHQALRDKVYQHLTVIYPDHDVVRLGDELLGIMGLDVKCNKPRPHKNNWDQQDVLAITYGDTYGWSRSNRI
jgi:sucrose phosphorylase